MDANPSRSEVYRLHLCGVSLIVLWLFLAGWPGPLLAQVPDAGSQVEALVGMSDAAESLPLTTAQEQARQLATALAGTPDAAPTSKRRTLLGIVTEQPVRLGTRVVLPLLTGPGVEGRLVSGEQTFASPVEEGVTVAEDAQRPLFLPAAKAAVAVELLVE